MSAPKQPRKHHTPGPWRVKIRRARDNENQVAIVRGVSVVGPYFAASCGADAQLISAAPDLYEACREAIRTFPLNADGAKARDMLYEAIAKAEGGGG